MQFEKVKQRILDRITSIYLPLLQSATSTSELVQPSKILTKEIMSFVEPDSQVEFVSGLNKMT